MSAKRSDTLPLTGAIGAAVAVVCCAGLPALVAFLGGLGTAALLAGSGAVLLAGVLGAVVGLLRARQRRCATRQQRSRS
jgi:hypothetical protein